MKKHTYATIACIMLLFIQCRKQEITPVDNVSIQQSAIPGSKSEAEINREFAAAFLNTTSRYVFPDSYTISDMPPVLDQGMNVTIVQPGMIAALNQGINWTFGSHAAATLHSKMIRVSKGLPYSDSGAIMSPYYIYNNIWPNIIATESIFGFLYHTGNLNQATWPVNAPQGSANFIFYSQFNGMAAANKTGGIFYIPMISGTRASSNAVLDMDHIKYIIGAFNRPVAVRVFIDKFKGITLDADGVWSKIGFQKVTAHIYQQHWVTLYGYDAPSDCFLAQNSWGVNWLNSDAGKFKIKAQTLKYATNDAVFLKFMGE
jgi:hypothetical protein